MAYKYTGIGGRETKEFSETVKNKVSAQKNKIAEAQDAEQQAEE